MGGGECHVAVGRVALDLGELGGDADGRGACALEVEGGVEAARLVVEIGIVGVAGDVEVRAIALELRKHLVVGTDGEQRGERATLLAAVARAEAGGRGYAALDTYVGLTCMDEAAAKPDASGVVAIEQAGDGDELCGQRLRKKANDARRSTIWYMFSRSSLSVWLVG